MVTEAEARKQDRIAAAIERARRQMQFDDKVARHFMDGLSIIESARLLLCTKKRVERSRGWQGFEGRVEEELINEIQLARSKRQRLHDRSVCEQYAAGRSVADSALVLEVPPSEVLSSRAYLGLQTGRSTWRGGQLTGRLNTRAAIDRMRAHFRQSDWTHQPGA